MNQLILLSIGVILLSLGSVFGYYARQSIAKKQADTIELKLQSRIAKAKEISEQILSEARQKA